MTRLDDFDLIAFDADDTLWQSEDSFNRAELAFFELVGPHCPVGVDVEEALRAVERADLSVSGYGVKAFTISMVRAAISASNRTVPVEVIEQLVEMGQRLKACPYYGARKAIKLAQIIAMPYNLLLHKSTRESVGLRLKGNIVIVDEAHNLMETIESIHSIQVGGSVLERASAQLGQYRERYSATFYAQRRPVPPFYTQ